MPILETARINIYDEDDNYLLTIIRRLRYKKSDKPISKALYIIYKKRRIDVTLCELNYPAYFAIWKFGGE